VGHIEKKLKDAICLFFVFVFFPNFTLGFSRLSSKIHDFLKWREEENLDTIERLFLGTILE